MLDWDSKNSDWFVIRVACNLSVEFADEKDQADDEPDAEDPDESIATVEFEYAALFSCAMHDGDTPLEEDELTAYGATTAKFLLYPFIREYIHDITGRLGLPPLTIGVLSRPMP